jgi:hypothetical protein
VRATVAIALEDIALSERQFNRMLEGLIEIVDQIGLVLATENFWSLRLKPRLAQLSELLFLANLLLVKVIPPINIDVSRSSGPDMFQLLVAWKLPLLLQLLMNT